MAGALSTLGLGSQGVLTNDLLDKLKDADKASTIKPIENKQKSLTLQQAGLTGIKDAISSLSDLATSLSDLTLYQSKSSTVTGDTVSIEATSSTPAQSFDIHVNSLATRDIHQSQGYPSKTDTLTAGNMHLEIDGSSYDVTIEDTDTLETLADKISDATEGKITGSILNVGGDTPYTMVLKSTQSGTSNNITVSGDISFTQIGTGAQDADLTIDGISVSSASNELTELIEGATITLSKTGDSHIDISQDSEKITEKMDEFVSKYNELIDTIKTTTNYDPDTKVAGVFSGSSEIRGLMGPLNDIFFTAISDSGKMIEDFGLSADRNGKLTLDKEKFQESLSSDSQSVQDFFIGKGAEEGIFRKMSGSLFDIGTSSDGILKTLKTNYDDKSKILADSLQQAQDRLESKYDILQKRFASFDAVIGRLSNASSTLTSLIDAQNNKN